MKLLDWEQLEVTTEVSSPEAKIYEMLTADMPGADWEIIPLENGRYLVYQNDDLIGCAYYTPETGAVIE